MRKKTEKMKSEVESIEKKRLNCKKTVKNSQAKTDQNENAQKFNSKSKGNKLVALSAHWDL